MLAFRKKEVISLPYAFKTKKNAALNCFEWMEALVTALIAVVFIFTFLFRVVSVSGRSMEPNLQSGDRVVVSSYFYTPQPGDIVVITRTAGINQPIIKRVIATEGQKVDIDFDKGVVLVDGKALDESAYIQNGITTQRSDFEFPLTVPEGYVFVLGDNRPLSTDSRSREVGMVDERYVLGKAEMVIFPFNRVQFIS